ncbi:MAG: thioredoxin-disulfide reductase [Planctomycetota bacterium]|nr:MAG: thioredoxin-disulfide reductase [Planctomycetota bacterium]
MSNHKVIIIGGGPAGYTAALYTARARLEPFCLEGLQYGGQLMTTTEVENFPGFPEGIDGPALMDRMRQQAERFGAQYRSRDVTRVAFSSDPGEPHTVWVDEDESYTAPVVIVATGARPRKLGLESEERLWAKGVSSCATCDGAFFRDKVVAVVGGGDSAMEEALFLTRFARKVYIIHRRDELRASRIMQERALANEKIELLWSYVVEEILGEDHVTGLRLRSTKDGSERLLEVDGFFLGIGHLPNTDIFRGQLRMDDEGYLVPEGATAMDRPGVFACGDCVDKRYRQAITAAGMGCMAAIDAERYLEERGL